MSELRDAALLLRRIPYGDTSLILHLFTELHGRIALMAKGARSGKSQLRPELAELHRLLIVWRPARTGMGTLILAERREPLLPEPRHLEGLELLSVAAELHPEGSPSGYEHLSAALPFLAQRREPSALPAALWLLLVQSGWVGRLDHCWSCGRQVGEEPMAWSHSELYCRDCGSGSQLPFAQRQRLRRYMVAPDAAPAAGDLRIWRAMLQDVLRQHGVRPPATI